MDASTLAARPPADPGLVNFDVFGGLCADPILIRPDHSSTELVENPEVVTEPAWEIRTVG